MSNIKCLDSDEASCDDDFGILVSLRWRSRVSAPAPTENPNDKDNDVDEKGEKESYEELEEDMEKRSDNGKFDDGMYDEPLLRNKENIQWMNGLKCNVHLCLQKDRNCFITFHQK